MLIFSRAHTRITHTYTTHALTHIHTHIYSHKYTYVPIDMLFHSEIKGQGELSLKEFSFLFEQCRLNSDTH